MAILKIVYLPDHRLRARSSDVTEFDTALQQLIDDMFDTMYDARGVGLAAPQVGINKRLSVIDVTEDKSQPLVLINPEITQRHGETIFDEGCLSLPGSYDKVKRSTYVTVRALDRDGKSYELSADGLLAECIQHEIDHLNGVLFIDLLSPLKRDRARKKLEKYLRSMEKK